MEEVGRCPEVSPTRDLGIARTLEVIIRQRPHKLLPEQSILCIRAAIPRLFCEGMSLTMSSAVRPFLSTMFTSIPGKCKWSWSIRRLNSCKNRAHNDSSDANVV